MQRRLVATLLAPILGVLFTDAPLPKAGHAQRRSPVDGIWEYMTPGVRGQAYLFSGHYVFFWGRSDLIPALPTTVPLPDSVRAKLFSGLLLDAGTFTLTDTIVTAHTDYNKDPRQVGTWRWSFSIKGDTMTYHVLDAVGQATSFGKARRIHVAE